MHQPSGTNTDPVAFPPDRGLRSRATRAVRRMMDELVVCHHQRWGEPPGAREGRADEINANWAALERTYGALGDDASRELLTELLVHRILGPGSHRLSINGPAYWAKRDVVATMRVAGQEGPRPGGLLALDWFDVSLAGVPARLLCHELLVLNTFLLEQYRYRVGDVVIEVEPGDVVLDAGTCWGDTALYFAHRVGPMGRVVGLEPVASNLEVLRCNLAWNPRLAEVVSVVERPIWGAPGVDVSFHDSGASTSVSRGVGSSSAVTTTVDALVTDLGLERVDFIKMDIEGAELSALRGAADTLTRFGPKVAISAYHHAADLADLPALLSAFDYELYLAHFTIHQEETVLFGRPAGRS